jgi:hypothetical protein
MMGIVRSWIRRLRSRRARRAWRLLIKKMKMRRLSLR